MNRSELENMVFEIASDSMEYCGESDQLMDEIRQSTTEQMIKYIADYYDHLTLFEA